MAGLRERHKADRTRRIIDTASQMFRENGYDAVRIEDIAQAAEVSVGTCYNYFSTKGDLLLAIVSMEVEEVIEHGKAVIAAPPAQIAHALDSLIGIYFDHSLHYLSKEMWRTAMAQSIEAPDSPFSARYTELDGMLAGQVRDLLGELQRRGYIRAELDADILGRVIFNNINQMFVEFVKQDTMALSTLLSDTKRHNEILASLCEPTRN